MAKKIKPQRRTLQELDKEVESTNSKLNVVSDAPTDESPRPPSPSSSSPSVLDRRTKQELNDSSPEFSRKKSPRGIYLPELDSNDQVGQTAKSEGQANIYRAEHRPLTPILYMMDDNQESAEAIRLRTRQTVIGRTRGDIKIPNDAHVSDRHVEIRREFANERYFWLLSDLKSTNGTYVQVQKQHLNEGDCLFLGGRYFCFSKFDEESDEDDGLESVRFGLVQFAHRKRDQRLLYTLSRDKENIIGNQQFDAGGNEWQDAFLDRQHARITCDNQHRWMIEDLGSRNGTWIRFKSLELEDGISFQVGGQRFVFCVES